MTQESTTGAIEALIVLTEPQGQAAEAYRTLAANLQYARPDEQLRTILLTSARPDDGKTTTLANLGVTAARAGRSVILVDCDLRRPGLHRIFGLGNTTGVATVLQQHAPVQEALQLSSVPGLRILTSGPPPPNPADVLGGPATKPLLEELAASADLVLVDAPPVTRVADASLLAPLVDGVILVVTAMRTRREQAIEAKAQLDRVNASVLGVILNNAHVDRDAFRY